MTEPRHPGGCAPTLYVDTTHALGLRFSLFHVGGSFLSPHTYCGQESVLLPDGPFVATPESSGQGSKGVEESWAGSPLPSDQLCSPFSLVEVLPHASHRKLNCQGSTRNAGIGDWRGGRGPGFALSSKALAASWAASASL